MAKSGRGLDVYLSEGDKELFEIAVKKYGIGKSELARTIISGWLFNNRLQILDKK